MNDYQTYIVFEFKDQAYALNRTHWVNPETNHHVNAKDILENKKAEIEFQILHFLGVNTNYFGQFNPQVVRARSHRQAIQLVVGN